eukprot:CAMPEP_0185800912 /NCGR_PEP_ID=MMETSP1322-20130828/1139_1 /TAXON_ID=265543 /ORGANISM="Minutocellus polymorphus, Strain RCC2270" /LENGTH=815 /DNA_ID=CAMNT_0028496577 /DNA_START=50 /DNA_END=2497 /DNA_ORIENTATION=+
MVFTCCNTAADAVHDKAKSAKAKYLKSMSAPAADLITGVLKLDIIAGRNLPNVDVNLLRRKNKSGKLDVSDPYVTVDTVARGKKTARLIKTSVINDDLNPTWRESFNISLCHEADSLFFAVKDLDLMATDFMGSMSIRIEDVLAEKELKGWYPLQGKSGKPAGELEIHLRFVSADELTATNEVPDVIFPLRSGCGYRPYQDAHTPKVSPITDVVARDGKPYDPPQLWIDTERAIKDAKKFIYIWGWAIWAELELVREDDSQKKWETLGEILKKKAKEGVRVLIMVWDEFMSTDVNPVGLMGTHDEQTEAYFKGTGVTVFKCPREKSGHAAKMGDAFMAKTTYTHHQKGVLVDAAVPDAGPFSKSRRIIGFMGGIDLTDGRYDTPDHSLFKTLKTKHKNDFYCNVTLANTGDTGPREPWHDIHCYYDGAIALDLLKNFEDRWEKQNPSKQDLLLSISQKNDFVVDWTRPEADPSSWSCQLFRSINSDSVNFHRDIHDKINVRKGRRYDDSIQKAYIHHIRRAKRYIYIENQYFLGSCHSWLVHETLKAPNTVPIELCARVEKAIDNDEEFKVYICIPLHPEGEPTSAAVQEILRWQSRTMEMMMDRIARTLHKKGLADKHPTDYLMFFTPTKQESPDEVPSDLAKPTSGTVAAKSRKSLRYMIYVHSKLAIFDDEYMIVGSANINDRSLNGNRDSEMCVGAYQPAFTKEKCGDGEIEGDVRTFRLALWAEHCGKAMPEHLRANSDECMKAIRQMADENQASYIADEPKGVKGHWMSYPLNYGKGTVTSLANCKNFPDTGGLIIGKASNFLPNSITT